MKFRARMTDQNSIKVFAHLITSLQKLSRLMTLRIHPDKLIFLLSSGGSNNNVTSAAVSQLPPPSVTMNGAVAFCEIPSNEYFSEYNMEGLGKEGEEDNAIYMEVAADTFASSLTTLKSTHYETSLKLKLTKKLVPCLTVEIESQPHNTPIVTCIHDIPVKLISKKNWGEYQCPEEETNQFHISLALPDFKQLRLTLERMRHLSTKIVFKMSREGKLVLSVATYIVQSVVTFEGLTVFDVDDEENNGTPVVRGSDAHYSVEVDMRAVMNFIPTCEGAVKPTNGVCSMTESRMLHWLIQYGGIQLQYFVPGSAAV